MSSHAPRAQQNFVGTAMAIARSVTAALLPIMAIVFIGFLVIGMALPVLTLHVHQSLGMSTFVVGFFAGSQFVAALITRVWSGHYADSEIRPHRLSDWP
jgi:hypothetical protein